MILHLDWETRSACDLKACGLDVYAHHPTTDIIVGAWAIDDDEPTTWFPGQDVPQEVLHLILRGDEVWAHNAPFEIEICNLVGKRYGWPEIKYKQATCTMSMAYAMALPGSLEKAAAAMGITDGKDMVGHRLMMQMSKPRETKSDGTIVWWESEEKLARLAEYCKQDVRVERILAKRLLKLTPQMRRVWLLDQKINRRGVAINIAEINAAMEIVEIEKKRLDEDMRRVTGNCVANCKSSGQLKDWLRWEGIETDSVDAPSVTSLLESEPSPHIRAALLLRQEGAKSSTAKLIAMKNGISDGRIRGLFQYHGAATGRWAGRRVQLQNLPRPHLKQKDIDFVFELLKSPTIVARDTIDMFYGSPMTVLSDCLRGLLVPSPGKVFICCDFNSIEARVLAWLAGETRVLEIFRGHGLLYEDQAANIHHVPIGEVTKDQRQIGKVAVLALGYGGGKGAFQTMAGNYGVKVSDERAEEIKVEYRNANQKIVQFWHNLERAAISAVRNPGATTSAGPIKFKQNGSFLWCRLPSGRVLCYPYPRIEDVMTPWGAMKEALTYMFEDPLSHKWVRGSTYGGSLAENVTQAVACDIEAEAMLRLEDAAYSVVMHTHDEVVTEVNLEFGFNLEEMISIMIHPPVWAKDLPLAAEGWISKRYQK
ncbi:DNA polymerase [Caudoviricetes sp.]|nr:DNA polymerase [Caudoviricetes sp.]